MAAASLTVLPSIPGQKCLITLAPGLGWFISRIRIRFVGGLICSFWWIIWSRFLSFAWLLASGFWLLVAGQGASTLFFWKNNSLRSDIFFRQKSVPAP